ncbi:ATP-binding protein [Bradyrhizobium japonicum]|uniref:ATP-binding protein n=1 Tax=Bradyrhizobium japonicum TaxID=375 RepID=UPI001BAE29AB|nr:winged helix-turn-helix domain-containing protein [Bradyrhizobium japonicum]MBR0961937.1 helix-turn-helix transcriptional regulator [Bradyrhizobium japonicum]
MTADTVITQEVSAVGPPDALPRATQANVPAQSSAAKDFFAFGPYRLFPRQRLLLKDGNALPIGNRSLEILILLAERQGEVVGKNELIARVWPGINIDEGGLRVQVAGLRKALGDGLDGACYIKTVAGRGYCLVATTGHLESTGALARGKERGQAQRLPLPLARMVGRDNDVRMVSDLLRTTRFVTVHGPGGVGKTTAAIAVAHDQLASFQGDIHFLDLAKITEPHLLPVALASSFGLTAPSSDPNAAMLEFVRDRRMLLIFDSCEHLIDAAAALIEKILREAPEIRVLATSRETLRADGEHVYRLSGLECPSVEDEQSAERLFSHPALSLFIDKVAASGHQFELTESNAQIVAKICRRLDGVALAINLAAMRVPAFGLSQIVGSLETNTWLFWQGHRTALPRHQTMAASIDWSYSLLEEDEKAVLHHLSAYGEPFTLDAACEAARQVLPTPFDDLLVIDKLITKSLISFEAGEGLARYRLLNSIRSYALERRDTAVSLKEPRRTFAACGHGCSVDSSTTALSEPTPPSRS